MQLDDIVIKLKERLLDVSYRNQKGFLSSSFSIMDILVCLYYEIMNNDDQMVLSKGHAAFGLYAILEDLGQIEEGELDTFGKYGSRLSLMAGGKSVPGIYFSTGSLGVGLSEAVGMAYAKKLKNEKGRIFVIIGDGELNEGSIWEGLISVVRFRLNNFVCIIDNNKSSKIWNNDGLEFSKMLPDGYMIANIDGHNHKDILNTLCSIASDQPLIVIANTIKGKGCKTMENYSELWHSKSPNLEEYTLLKGELYE